MIVLVGSQKGGVGKSMIATNLAAEWVRQGRDVVLVDADSQRTAARWHGDREDAGHLPAIACVEKRGNIRDTLLDLDKRYDLVVVDVAGKDSEELRSAMMAAHVMIAPFRPSQSDLDTLEHLSDVIKGAQAFRDDLVVYSLLTQIPPHSNTSERDEAREVLRDYPVIRPLRAEIHERKAYRQAASEGLGAVEWTNSKAKAEIQVLAGEVLA